MYGRELAYVALVVDDVDAAARTWAKDFGLVRSEHRIGAAAVPLLSVGQTALALFPKGDPFVGGQAWTGVHHIALAVKDVSAAAIALKERGLRA